MYKLSEIKGVIPAVMTCFNENGDFDEKRQRALIDYFLQNKVNGLYLTGSSGEAFLMESKEREKVVEVVIDAVSGRIPIIVHVGDVGTRKSIKLAQHAYKVGADAISSVPPFYFNFSNEEIFSYYKDLSE